MSGRQIFTFILILAVKFSLGQKWKLPQPNLDSVIFLPKSDMVRCLQKNFDEGITEAISSRTDSILLYRIVIEKKNATVYRKTMFVKGSSISGTTFWRNAEAISEKEFEYETNPKH